jgi:sporadic carbohydrate cluster protein (TIGR04323 family)
VDPRVDPNFDISFLEYDHARFAFRDWALDVIREKHPRVAELERLHEYFSPSELVHVQQHVQGACGRRSFTDLCDSFLYEYIQPLLGGRRFMVQRFGTMRCVVPNQAALGRLLQFHQGIWVGNGWGLRTVWLPFTRCFDTNTIYIVPFAESRQITHECYEHRWDHDTLYAECLRHALPIQIGPGQACLFMQGHLHGNVNNTTEITRVSMDIRVLVEGEQCHRKLPGGYFRWPGTASDGAPEDYGGKKFVTYVGWNTAFTKHIPLPMQRIYIEEYCKKRNIEYNDYQFENEYLDWMPALRKFITADRPFGIVMLSIHALPDDETWRNEILEAAVRHGVELHFANELMVLRSREDIARITDLLSFSDDRSTPKSD